MQGPRQVDELYLHIIAADLPIAVDVDLPANIGKVRFLAVSGGRVRPASRSPFLGARAILVLKDLETDAAFNQDLIAKVFELTPAQARLAIRLAGGSSVEEAALESGVALETARSHLKAIFNKTETHRQGELVALLNKVSALG